MGFFDRLKQGLKKTNQLLHTDIRDLFKSEGRLVEDAFLEELRRDLIRTDMGPQAANQIAAQIGTEFRARVIHRHEAIDVIKANLKPLKELKDALLAKETVESEEVEVLLKDTKLPKVAALY